MSNQLKGISLGILGIIMMMFSMLNPWIPIVDSLVTELSPFIGLACGIIGVVLAFKSEE